MILLPQTETEFMNALIAAAEIGAKRALVEAGVLKPYISLRTAQRQYGAGTLKRWIANGLVKPLKDGDRTARVRIDRIQIESVAKTANRAAYFASLRLASN